MSGHLTAVSAPAGALRATAGQVAIVVPFGDSPELSADERVSLRHLETYLAAYDRFAVLPRGRRANLPGFRARWFDARYFGSADAHTRLMLSRRFYETFAAYEFILVYHLDALVFSDRLAAWCGAGYDYIGAPWLRSRQRPADGLAGVGNGGFSLRRVRAFLDVLGSRRRGVDPDAYWRRRFAGRPPAQRLAGLPRKWLKHLRAFNGIGWEVRRWRRNEDIFWARVAPLYRPGFRIAPPDVALRFAFECAPRQCFELNGRELPFGCHAWNRYDRGFWEPHLLAREDGA